MRMTRYDLIKAKSEKLLGRLAIKCYSAPLIPVLLCSAILLFFSYHCLSLQLDSSMKSYLHKDDTIFEVYTDFQNRFGSDNVVLLGISSKDLLQSSFLLKLAQFHKALETRVPHITHAASLINAPRIEGNSSGLSLGTLEDILPQTPQEEQLFRKTVEHSSFYKKRYYSADQRLALLSLSLGCPGIQQDTEDILRELTSEAEYTTTNEQNTYCRLTNDQNKEMILAVKQTAAEFQESNFDIHLTGMPALRDFLNTVMKKDLKKFLIISFVIMIFILACLFRYLTGILAPLIIVCFTLLSTLGLIAFLDIPFQAPTRIIPTFLISVTISTTVHILVIFFQQRAHGEQGAPAVCRAMQHSGIPVILTSVTTAIGLASFGTASIVPVRNLGLCAAAGVTFSLFYTLVLLPALLALLPATPAGKKADAVFTLFKPALLRVAKFSTRNPRLISIMFLTCFIISLITLQHVRFVYNPMLRLPVNEPLRTSTEFISSHFPGLARVEILVDTGKEDGLLSTDTAVRFSEFSDEISRFEQNGLAVYSVNSIYDLIKELTRELTGSSIQNDQQKDALLSQEMFLLEQALPKTLNSLVDGHFETGRISVSVPWTDALAYEPLFSYLRSVAENYFDTMKEVQFTGTVPLLTRTVGAAIESMVKSYTIAFSVISIAMIILIGSLRLGMISMIPNLLPICFTLGYMGLVGIPMDIYALLIGSIALGIVVDDTIHFMHNFQKYYHRSNNVEEAVCQTFTTTGMAMLVTTTTLASGSFVFMFSEMTDIRYFGMLTGLTVLLALLADFLLAPALMALYYNYTKGEDICPLPADTSLK